MNKIINKIINIIMFLSLAIGGMIIPGITQAQNSICIADVIKCPDGTFVSRVGSKCEFICNGKKITLSPIKVKKVKVDKNIVLIEKLKLQIAFIKEKIQKILKQKTMKNQKNQKKIIFTKNLKIGSIDKYTKNEVTKLQKLLISENVYPEKIVSGYYGKLTSKAVKRLKLKYGIDNYPGVEWSPKIYNAFKNSKKIKNSIGIGKICTLEYKPVCGEVEEELACDNEPCAPSMAYKKTFSNRCMMENANARFLYEGECDNGKPKLDFSSNFPDDLNPINLDIKFD